MTAPGSDPNGSTCVGDGERRGPAARPGGAAPAARLRAQTVMELRLTLRRGESLLLTLVIPVALLLFFGAVRLPGTGIDFLVPGVLALAVMSTAFTGLAIATGYERAYGVLTRLGTTPLTRAELLAAKTLGVLGVELLQAGVICAVGALLGWSPHPEVPAVLALLVTGTAAFAGLGLLMAGTLRAEATLAGANGLYLVLLLLGGVAFPPSRLPGWLAGLGGVLPTGALSGGLRAALSGTGGAPIGALLTLAAWAAACLLLAARTFRWDAG